MNKKKKIVFSVQDVVKLYGQTVALNNISVKIRKGHITAIYGPNGAGKSTLVKILCGVEKASKGNVTFNGVNMNFSEYMDALKAGISYMPQDFGLIPSLTGWENIKVAQNQLKGLFWYNEELNVTNDKEIQSSLDIDLSFFNRRVSELTNYQKQILAIYKAVSFDSSVYIFDESTTNLNHKDFLRFATLLTELKSRGISILFISHKIDEVFNVSDEIIVLRNGKLISQNPIGDADKNEVIKLFLSEGKLPIQEEVELSDLPSYHIKCQINEGYELDLDFFRGETIAIDTGDTSLDQQVGYKLYDWVSQHFKGKVGIIPGNRNIEGIYPNLSIMDNLIANSQQHKNEFLIKCEEKNILNSVAERLELKYESWGQNINELSGGNQQKIVFGRWMIADFDILILIEPTSGIDLKSKAIIHKTILQMASEGKSFILITSDEGERIKLNAKNIGVKELC